MSIQTRSTALQNEIVRLYCTFIKDGMLTNPIGQPTVEILDTDGVTVLDSVPAVMENTGIFYADWYVPKNLPLGNYYDRWFFQWDAISSVQELTMIITVHSLDSYINFISHGITVKTSNRVSQLMNDLANDFIYEAMHIPVYVEQGMRIQQDNQTKRSKSYYYFTLDGPYYYVEEGAIYTNGGKNFTVFQTLLPPETGSSSSSSMEYSSSSQSSTSSVDSSSSSSSSSLDSSSSSSSSSLESSSSSSSVSSSSESSSSISSSSSSSVDSSSSTSYQITNTTTTPYVVQTILTCVGSGDPTTSGTLTKVSGVGDDVLTFTSYDKKVSKFSTIYSFAYRNWNQDPSPIVRVNSSIADDGWHLDYDGKIYFDSLMAPEDSVAVAYNFSYFSQQELQSFLLLGLQMMNGLPPASTVYSSLEQSPFEWNAGILLYAAVTALKRLIFGWSWQEKRIIYGRPEDAAAVLAAWQDLYKSYNETWIEFGKNVKTLKLPGIAMYVTPEYTLPGGRCMSSDTCIRFMINGMNKVLTIKDACEISKSKEIFVQSVNEKNIAFEKVSKIWNSGNKSTYIVETCSKKIRLTKEHLVYMPDFGIFKPVMEIRKHDNILVEKNGELVKSKVIYDPYYFGKEEVFDMEVPSTENFIANGIVSHNSRWFRYLYKSGSGS